MRCKLAGSGAAPFGEQSVPPNAEEELTAMRGGKESRSGEACPEDVRNVRSMRPSQLSKASVAAESLAGPPPPTRTPLPSAQMQVACPEWVVTLGEAYGSSTCVDFATE